MKVSSNTPKSSGHSTQRPEAPRVVRPAKRPGYVPDEVHTHPAFGQVEVVRWSCGPGGARLYGSDLLHRCGITLTFKTSELNRGLSSDHHFSREMLLEVQMSEAQWARFVSSQGQGGGTPVTVRYRRDGGLVDVPPIAPPEATKREKHGEEMAGGLRERLGAIQQLADDLETAIEDRAGARRLREIQRELARHAEQLPGSVQFVYDQFARATERVAEDAKIEVEAHVAGVATRLGLEHLRDLAPQLEEGKK